MSIIAQQTKAKKPTELTSQCIKCVNAQCVCVCPRGVFTARPGASVQIKKKGTLDLTCHSVPSKPPKTGGSPTVTMSVWHSGSKLLADPYSPWRCPAFEVCPPLPSPFLGLGTGGGGARPPSSLPSPQSAAHNPRSKNIQCRRCLHKKHGFCPPLGFSRPSNQTSPGDVWLEGRLKVRRWGFRV